ncbi:MAG: hypothetical protein WBD95_16525 [Xanthobacteraceae bacterium]
MPLFFFQITHGPETFPQAELDLLNPDAAREQATITAGEMLRDMRGGFLPGTEWRLDVADHSQKTFFRLRIIAEAFS